MDDEQRGPSGRGGDKVDGETPRQDRRSQAVDDILTRDLRANVSRSGPKLRELLAGTILVRCTDSGKRYLIDWSQTELQSQPTGPETTAECTISLSEDNLRKIAAGDLNPQIAMLSDKVKVEGRKGAAMYLFNLIAPQQGI